MGNIDGEQTPWRGIHHLERRGGLSGWGNEELWDKRGKSYIPAWPETLVCCQCIHPPQRPTEDTSGSIDLSVQAGGGGDDASRIPQCQPGTTKRPTGGVICNNHCELWAVRPVTALHPKTEVTSGGKLDVEDVERMETYIGTRELHTRDESEVFLKCGN